MTKNELNYFRINLQAVMAFLAEQKKEPDDVPDQYRKVIIKTLDTIEKMDFELTKTIAYNQILIVSI